MFLNKYILYFPHMLYFKIYDLVYKDKNIKNLQQLYKLENTSASSLGESVI